MAESDVPAKPPNLPPGKDQATPSKFNSHILYKILMAIFFLVILPLVPSQAPEFVNQTLLTRTWELLHLLFVGIAVSYGLFSRRNDEKEDGISVSNFDNVQSYVSGLLHVSSVFDDEAETPSANDESMSSSDGNKVQTWSNRYFRNESLVVAEESPVVNEQRVRSEKPLLLPVRSLNSQVVVDDESRTVSGSTSRVSSGRLLSNSKRSSNGEFGGLSLEGIEDNLNENVVLPSPVPWRSRSGRTEVQEEADNPPVYSPAVPMEESESNWIDSRSSRPQTSRSFQASAIKLSPPSPSPFPRKPSPSPNVSPELKAKSSEDSVRKKSFFPSPPPPPPPPPPPHVRRIASMKPSSLLNDNDVPHQKDLKRSVTTSKPRRSIRDTGDDIDMVMGTNSSAEALPRNYDDILSMGKSIRKIRPGEVANEPTRRGREFGGNDQLKGKMIDQNTHVQAFEENPIEFPDDDKKEPVEKLGMETDDDDDMESEEEDNNMVGKFIREDNGEPFNVNRRDNERSSSNEEAGGSSNLSNDGGPDVDKKADEFIAKFREQIRLQRIESIKRSTGQIRRNTSKQS
ncbi:uncharacterized protein DDB_G0284459-like [Cucurbita maxima]|uniref:Uncharacterized protein DDB_G0284459-like n=1 Tax=Cucurbita maxima TaxID=3661 RepID=A0A6J1L1K4_CUCMA|nr:uncharacterized protein DDB_G0284459-like [Cucurbita maxima]